MCNHSKGDSAEIKYNPICCSASGLRRPSLELYSSRGFFRGIERPTMMMIGFLGNRVAILAGLRKGACIQSTAQDRPRRSPSELLELRSTPLITHAPWLTLQVMGYLNIGHLLCVKQDLAASMGFASRGMGYGSSWLYYFETLFPANQLGGKKPMGCKGVWVK